MIITPSDLQGTIVNANLDDLYLENAINEAEGVYLREILGDLLYNTIINKINSQTLTGKYATLVDQYVKIYLQYKAQSLLVPQVAFKIRNAGVISQYDQGFNTTSVKDTMYVQEQIDSKAEFYANRLTVYLQKNAASFPEYGYSEDNITQPTESQNVTTLYLGGGRKNCGCSTPSKGGGGGGTGDTVDWSDVTNKPNFATVATSGDYDDLSNKPSLDSYVTKTYVDNAIQQVEQEMPTVPTNVSAFTNDAGYLTQHQSLQGLATENYVDNAIQQVEGNIPTKTSELTNDSGYLTQHQSLDGYATENWVQQQGFSTFSGSYNDLADKPSIPTVNDAVLTIKQGGVTKGTFTANSNENIEINLEAGGSGSTDWNDIKNKPSFATVATSGSYTDLSNRPAVKEDLDLSTLTQAQYVDFYTNYNTYKANYDLNWGGLPILSINSWQPDTSMSPVPVIVLQYGIYGQSALMTGGDDEVYFGVQLIAADGSVIPYSDSMVFKQICHTASYNDLVDKPQIPTVPTNVSAFTNDAGYLTQHQSLTGYATENWVQQQGYSTFDGNYNSLTNKPTIPAAQVQSDWNATSGMGQILNKPSMTAETWTFTVDDGQGGTTTVTKTVWLQ